MHHTHTHMHRATQQIIQAYLPPVLAVLDMCPCVHATAYQQQATQRKASTLKHMLLKGFKVLLMHAKQ